MEVLSSIRNQPMRLLVVIASLTAEGTPVLTLDLCRQWRSMGIEAIVVCLSAGAGELASEFARHGITVRSLNLPDAGRMRYVRLTASMYQTCREFKPVALLSMLFGWHAFLALGARLAGVPRVVAHVGNYPPPRENPTFSKFRWLVQAGRPLTNTLVCCSRYVAQGVVERFGVSSAETEVIYNGADVEHIASHAQVARRNRTTKQRLIVGMVARLEMHKDQPTLIRATKLLRDAGLDVETWLIGDGSRRREYAQLIADLGISDVVKLLGVRREIPELLGQLDVFAFAATPDEGQGVALVEAMAAGVPIVAADVGACREVLDRGELGLLVPPFQPVALAEAIKRVRQAPEEAIARAQLARSKADSNFNIDSMARAYATCLRRAAS